MGFELVGADGFDLAAGTDLLIYDETGVSESDNFQSGSRRGDLKAVGYPPLGRSTE